MSSLTSIGVNKNSTRFAPKVNKARPTRRPPPKPAANDQPSTSTAEQQQQQQSSENETHQQEAPPPPPTQQESMPALSDAVTITPYDMTPPPPEPISIPEPANAPERTPTPAPAHKPSDRTKTKKKPKGNAIDIPTSSSSSRGVPIDIPTPSAQQQQQQEDTDSDDHEPIPVGGDTCARARRKKGSNNNKKRKTRDEEDPSQLQTLDDINCDPARKDYLDRPMADFIKDLRTGVVSRQFKEHEIERYKKRKRDEEREKLAPEERERLLQQEKEEEERLRAAAEEERRRQEEERRRQEEESQHVLRETSNAPQVRLINGQIVLDAESLVVERRNQFETLDTSNMEVVEETSMSRVVNSQTYGKFKKTPRWTKEETDLFYEALSLFGTDFEMASHILRGRSRVQIRMKFNREEKVNPEKVKEHLLRKKKPIDLEKLKELTGQEFEEAPEDLYSITLV